MSYKLLLGSVGIGLVVVGGSYFVIAPRVSDTQVAPYEQESDKKDDAVKEESDDISDKGAAEETDDEPTEDTEESDSEIMTPTTPASVSTVNKEVPVQTTPTTPTQTTTPTPTPTPTPSGYTVLEVAKHADATSCWSIINGNVYDLTAFVSKHPGGKSKILGICGEDGTRSFENQHGDSSKVATILGKYLLGPLAK